MTASQTSKIEELVEFDKGQCCGVLIGTDEAGRGPVAGPVFAAAVCFKEFDSYMFKILSQLNDSKKLNEKTRKELFKDIQNISYFSVQQSTVEQIEKINILQASLLAMKNASTDVLNQMQEARNPLVLVDGKILIPNFKINQKWVVKGDSKSASIAAASILAKVSRDEFMYKLAEEYPQYKWQQNKGYGTKAHMSAIQEFGITKWHRKSFLTKYLI